jgi:hypothetical protein
VQETSGNPSVPKKERSSGHGALRAVSNTSLVEEAARKALSAQELERKVEQFRQLCLEPGNDVRVLEETAEVLRNAGFKNELMNLLREALEKAEVNPHVGALWVRRVVNSKIWDHRYPEGLDALCKEGETGHRAVIEFLDIMGRKRQGALIQKAVARHARWLRTHPEGWAAAGQALVQARDYSKAARWMSDWRNKPQLDLPTLSSLALALRATGRAKAADEVVQLALARPGAAEEFPILKLWVAQDLVFAGSTQPASATFKQIDTTGWDDDSLALYYLVRGVIRVQKAEPANRKETFDLAQERVAELFRRAPIYKRDIFLRREYRRCLTRMAKDSGSWSQGIRATWRSAESWPFGLLLLIIPPLQVLAPCYFYRLCSRRQGVLKK